MASLVKVNLTTVVTFWCLQLWLRNDKLMRRIRLHRFHSTSSLNITQLFKLTMQHLFHVLKIFWFSKYFTIFERLSFSLFCWNMRQPFIYYSRYWRKMLFYKVRIVTIWLVRHHFCGSYCQGRPAKCFISILSTYSYPRPSLFKDSHLNNTLIWQ